MDQTVTRAMLADRAADETDLALVDTAAIGHRMFELIGGALMEGETVKLTGFGTLQVRERAERMGRNPRTGEEYPIVPHRTVMFIPGGRLKTALGHD